MKEIRISKDQALIMNTFKGERVYIELNNREKYDDVLCLGYEPLKGAFVIEVPGGHDLIHINSIFRMRNHDGKELKQGKIVADTHIKQYGAQTS